MKAILISCQQSDKAFVAYHSSFNSWTSKAVRLITSIKGIGNLTAYHILARRPDIEHFKSPKQFAAFIGVSPKQHQSGLMQGSRVRKTSKGLLYERFVQALQPFVNRLKAAGKKPQPILGAVMRKLAHYVFAVLKNKLPFCENYACT